jgi:hypothetical protein
MMKAIQQYYSKRLIRISDFRISEHGNVEIFMVTLMGKKINEWTPTPYNLSYFESWIKGYREAQA